MNDTTEITPRGGRRLSLLLWSGAAALLLAPAIAMQFTREINWTAFDFAVWGGMLAVAGGICELALRASGNLAFRAAVGLATATGFFIVWACGAVGIIGNEGDRANLMFVGAPLVAVAGAVVGRFKPNGLSRAMIVTALLQAAVALVAERLASPEGFVAGGVFTGAWVLAAWLFNRADRP